MAGFRGINAVTMNRPVKRLLEGSRASFTPMNAVR